MGFETFYELFQVCFDHSHYSRVLAVVTCQHRRCRLSSAASAHRSSRTLAVQKGAKSCLLGRSRACFACHPALRCRRLRCDQSAHGACMALTCLGLESAGLNNRRSSWQSEIVYVFISPTRVGIQLAPFLRSRPPFLPHLLAILRFFFPIEF